MDEQQIKIIRKEIMFWGLLVLSILFLSLGAIFNMLAVGFNDGKMPVKMDYHYFSDTHFSYNEMSEVNVPALTDYFNIRNSIWSIGDLLMLAGIFFLILNIVYCFIIFPISMKRKYGRYRF